MIRGVELEAVQQFAVTEYRAEFGKDGDGVDDEEQGEVEQRHDEDGSPRDVLGHASQASDESAGGGQSIAANEAGTDLERLSGGSLGVDWISGKQPFEQRAMQRDCWRAGRATANPRGFPFPLWDRADPSARQ